MSKMSLSPKVKANKICVPNKLICASWLTSMTIALKVSNKCLYDSSKKTIYNTHFSTSSFTFSCLYGSFQHQETMFLF